MKFFVPGAGSEAEAEHIWKAIRRFLAEQEYPTIERRIRRLAFHHDAEHFDLEVGGRHPGMEDEGPLDDRPENPAIRCIVYAILEAAGRDCYYLCLPYRGVYRAYPWLVGSSSVTAIEDFEP